MANGRPRKFNNPDELDKLVEEYIDNQLTLGEPILTIDFCVVMGIPKSTLYDYAKLDGYSDIIKKLQEAAEVSLITGAMKGKYNATFSIFLAKNHHGYRDKVEQETTVETKGTTVVEIVEDKNE